MQATTIKLFLVHGTPSGLRTGELSNWSGKAVAAPRSEISDLLKRSELSNPGIYVLTGVTPDTGDRAMYVGEAENVGKRLKSHSSKDFWNAATVFVSKDENLTKAHIRYLEGALIEKAQRVEKAHLMNAVSSGAKLPESDAAEMNVFLEKCLQLLPVLGVSEFNEATRLPENEIELLYCGIKGLVATGRRTENGFVIYEGSQAILDHRPSATHVKTKREALVAAGVLAERADHLVFTKDVEFGSPSTAGAIVRGGNTNGLTNWKNAAGIQLRDIEKNET